jgi:hypothetical protein
VMDLLRVTVLTLAARPLRKALLSGWLTVLDRSQAENPY